MTQKEYEEKFWKIMKARGFSEKTKYNYGGIFSQFLYKCFWNNIEPSNATDDFIIDFILSVKSNSAIRQRHGVIRNFFDWILGNKNRLKYIPYPPKEERIPNYFTLHELEDIISAIENKKQKAIVFTQYCCGLRVSEVVKIKRSDFIKKYDIRSKGFVFDLRVIGKCNKERMIPVPDYCLKVIRKYWDSISQKDKHPEYIFRGQFGEHYAPKTVQVIIKKALKKIGYSKKAATHTLRHSKASHLHHAGADLQDIADLLGHSNIETTRMYSHSNTSTLRASFIRAEQFMREELMAQKQEQQLLKLAS